MHISQAPHQSSRPRLHPISAPQGFGLSESFSHESCLEPPGRVRGFQPLATAGIPHLVSLGEARSHFPVPRPQVLRLQAHRLRPLAIQTPSGLTLTHSLLSTPREPLTGFLVQRREVSDQMVHCTDSPLSLQNFSFLFVPSFFFNHGQLHSIKFTTLTIFKCTVQCIKHIHVVAQLSCHVRGTQSCPTLWDPMNDSHQAPLSMGFSRQEYWRRLPYLPPGNLPYSGIEPASLMSPALASGFFSTSATWEAHDHHPSPILFFLLAKLRFYTHQIITPHSSLSQPLVTTIYSPAL